MTEPVEPSRSQKILRPLFAYLLFVACALLGIVVMYNIHTMVVNLCMLFDARTQVTRFFYVWGGFFLLGAYAVGVALMESYMNRAVKTGRVLSHGVRIFAIEIVLALLSEVIPWIAEIIVGP